MRKIHYLIIALMSALPGLSVADIVVVGSSKLGLEHLSEEDVQQIYLGKRRSVGGVTVTPLDLPSSDNSRDNFYGDVIGVSPSQLRAHWARMTFTGRGKPPRIVASDMELKNLLNQGNYIIYLDSSNVPDNARVLYGK